MASKSKIKFLETNGNRWSYCYGDPSSCSRHNHLSSRELAKLLSKDYEEIGFYDRTVIDTGGEETVSYIDYVVASSERHEKAFDCLDCGINTLYIGEYYMVHDNVWNSAGLKHGMVCVGCLEVRISRKLNKNDFTDAPVNSPNVMMMGQRIMSRLTSD